MIRLLAFALAVLVILVSLVPSTTSAQRNPGAAPSRGPGWLPRESNLPAAEYKLTPAQQTTVVNRLTEIERLFLQVDELARPSGFEVEPTFAGFVPHDTVLTYRYHAMFFVPSKKVAGEGNDCIRVEVNPVPGAYANESGYYDQADKMLFEDEQGEPIPGATHVVNRLSPTARSWLTVTFTSGKVPLLDTVTRERYLRAKIFSEGERLTQTRKATTQTSYEKWMAEAPMRKADREGFRRSLPPADAATFVKRLEDLEVSMGAELKKQEAGQKAEFAKVTSMYVQSVDRAQAQLAAMSPADRNAPAWLERRVAVLEKISPLDVPFTGPLTPVAGRVVVPKLDVYRNARSPIDARAIRVRFSASLTCNIPVVHRAIYQASQKLDWAAFARMVNSN